MSLAELYQELVLDHGRRPRNFREVQGANRTVEGHNPLCGDRITLFVRLEEDVVKDLGFLGQGCAIAKASASLMTGAVMGRTSTEARALFDGVHRLVTQGPNGIDSEQLGKLMALGGVSEFPMRVKCASLPWHALKAALDGGDTAVSTE